MHHVVYVLKYNVSAAFKLYCTITCIDPHADVSCDVISVLFEGCKKLDCFLDDNGYLKKGHRHPSCLKAFQIIMARGFCFIGISIVERLCQGYGDQLLQRGS